MSINFLKRFQNGLMQKYNMTIEDLEAYKYCGGTKGSHKNYWKIQYGDTPLPDRENKCVCGHHIVENCYITNGKELLVLGNCCIKKFVPKSTRTCEKCGEPHKNTTVNSCNACRPKSNKTCEKCGQPHKNRVVKICNDCRVGVCEGCGKKIDERYKKCYSCNFKT